MEKSKEKILHDLLEDHFETYENVVSGIFITDELDIGLGYMCFTIEGYLFKVMHQYVCEPHESNEFGVDSDGFKYVFENVGEDFKPISCLEAIEILKKKYD